MNAEMILGVKEFEYKMLSLGYPVSKLDKDDNDDYKDITINTLFSGWVIGRKDMYDAVTSEMEKRNYAH